MNRKASLVICGILMMLMVPVAFAQESPALPGQPEVLTLERSLELAAANSSDLKAAAKSVQIAEIAVEEAKAGFKPKLDYSIFANKAEDPIYPFSAMRLINPDYASTDFSGASISLTQPLYTGGKLTTGLQLAQTQLAMALENEKKAKQQLTFQIKQAFFQVWLAEQIQIVAENSLANLERHVEKVNEFYKAGVVSKFETLQAKVQRDSLKPQVIAAQMG